MKPQTDVIRECTNPDCALRFPEPAHSARGRICPLCGTVTMLAAHIDSAPEWNLRVSPPADGVHLEALLDNIRSVYNVGSIFRSADGSGLAHLHLCGITPTPDNPRVLKTALGAEGAVPWTYHRNAIQAARQCKDRGLQLWALEIDPRSQSAFEVIREASRTPILLVVGNEVTGVDPGLLEVCDRTLWIPMQGFKRSLNVANAFSILVYLLRYNAHLHSTIDRK